jgi:hypothetical protein
MPVGQCRTRGGGSPLDPALKATADIYKQQGEYPGSFALRLSR